MFVGIILNSNLKKVFYYKHLHYFSSNYYLYVIHLECLILWYIQFKFLMHVHPYRYFNRKIAPINLLIVKIIFYAVRNACFTHLKHAYAPNREKNQKSSQNMSILASHGQISLN